MGKAAAVALSQGYEVTAFRELITELKERNGAAEQKKMLENKQERARAPISFPYQLWEPAAKARRAVLAVNKLKKQTQNSCIKKEAAGLDCNRNWRFGKCKSKRWVLRGR